MAKRSWTSEEKESFIKEARIHTVSKVLKKYKLSSSLFYTWKRRYEARGLQGLEVHSEGKDRSLVFNQLIKERGNVLYAEEKIKLFEELISRMSVSEIPVTERVAMIRKYNKRGLPLTLLFDVCRITKRRYYLELQSLKQIK